jgi:uncharacterized protein with HEPN domain
MDTHTNEIERDELTLALMVEAAEKINSYVRDLTYDAFTAHSMAQSAVLMQITILGELSKKISVETKSHIDIPWHEIAAFRNKVVHDYFSVQLPIVWETAQADIPPLLKTLSSYIQESV